MWSRDIDYIQKAITYATKRWCWDDESHIRELCQKELTYDYPVAPGPFVDALAEEFEFDDPYEAYGCFRADHIKPEHPKW